MDDLCFLLVDMLLMLTRDRLADGDGLVTRGDTSCCCACDMLSMFCRVLLPALLLLLTNAALDILSVVLSKTIPFVVSPSLHQLSLVHRPMLEREVS